MQVSNFAYILTSSEELSHKKLHKFRKIICLTDENIPTILYCFRGGSTCDATYYIYSYQWTGGANGNLYLKFPSSISSWTINVQFSSTVNSLSVWDGTSSSCSGASCTFSNAGYNGQQLSGATLNLGFQVNFVVLFLFIITINIIHIYKRQS